MSKLVFYVGFIVLILTSVGPALSEASTGPAMNVALKTSTQEFTSLLKKYAQSDAQADISGSQISLRTQPGELTTRNQFARRVHMTFGSYAAELQGGCVTTPSARMATGSVDDLFSSLTDTQDEDLLKKLKVEQIKARLVDAIVALKSGSVLCTFSTSDTGETMGTTLAIYDVRTSIVTLMQMRMSN